MLEWIATIDPEQLLTATGFIGYLLWSNSKLQNRLDQSEAEKQQIVERYLKRVDQSNQDLTAAIRVFDDVVKGLRS